MLQNTEIIFDNVRPARLIAVAEGLLGTAMPIEIHQELLGLLRDTLGDDSLKIDSCEIVTDQEQPLRCHVRFTRFDGRYDVVIQFQLDPMELTSVSLARFLHQRSIAVAQQNRVSDYYGGLEPATDKGLRFFTAECPGPLLLDDSVEDIPNLADEEQSEPETLAERRKGFFRRK